MDDPEDKLHLSNKLVTNCLNEHTALKRGKITNIPCIMVKINTLQLQQNKARKKTHSTKAEGD